MSEMRKRYDREVREGAVRIGEETMKSVAQIALDLGVNEGTLGNWVVKARGPSSQPQVATRSHLQCLHRADVALDEGGEATVPGLGGDPIESDTGKGRGGSVSGGQGVAGDPLGAESGGPCASPQHSGDSLSGDRFVGDDAVAQAGEQRPGSVAAHGGPRNEQGERGQLRAAQCGGEAEQDDRGVASALRGGAVDAGDDLADLGQPERACLAAGCGAQGAAQTAAEVAGSGVIWRVEHQRSQARQAWP